MKKPVAAQDMKTNQQRFEHLHNKALFTVPLKPFMQPAANSRLESTTLLSLNASGTFSSSMAALSNKPNSLHNYVR